MLMIVLLPLTVWLFTGVQVLIIACLMTMRLGRPLPLSPVNALVIILFWPDFVADVIVNLKTKTERDS